MSNNLLLNFIYIKTFTCVMGFWKRNSSDPLLDSILKKYRLNLLSIPRENAQVGDLYMQDDNSNFVSTPGSITNFISPQLEIPQIKTEEMSNIAGQASNDISGKAGFDFLEGFLDKLGAVGIGGKIRGAYEGSKSNKIVFAFPNPRRDSIDPFEFGSKLRGKKFMTDNPLYAENRRYYVVTGVAKTKSISIEIQGDEKNLLDVTANISQIVDASGNLKLEKNQSGKITYTGNKDLAFGVELYELGYSDEKGKFEMSSSNKALVVRGNGEPALLGDKDGDAFISFQS